MNRFHLLLAAASAAALPSLASARPMTATDMHLMHRLAAPAVSPDGRYVVYQLSETDLAANKRRNKLYVLDLRTPGAKPTRLLPNSTDTSEHSPAFSPDGRGIYFLGGKSGSEQVWRIERGQKAQQVTNLATDVAGFMISPTGDRIAVWGDRDLRCADFNCAGVAPAKKAGSGLVYDQLFARHWDAWVEPGVRSRIFTLPLVAGKAQGAGVPIAPSLVGDAPSKPFGGSEEISWSRDGRTIYFAMREAGRIEATSTNLDIFAAPADGSAPPVNLTDANDAVDNLPSVSPDGRTLAYVAMARPGFEADRQIVQLRDLATGRTRALTQGWDRSVGALAWAPDGRSLIVEAQDTLESPLFRVDVASGRLTRLTREGTAHNARPLPDGTILFTMNSIRAPDDVYRLDRGGGRVAQLTAVNAARLAELDPVSFDKFSFAGAGGDRVWGYTLKPARASGKLPIAFIVHGGPQGSFNNSWSYRWNPRVFSSPGYAVVSVDFHGSTGYGQAFTDAVSRDWGGKPLEDLQKGLAHATSIDPQLDANRACALGGSYGGYMMNWIAGNWPDRFRCLVNHNGVFDTRSMGFMTEELWFTEWENGGTPWDAPQEYERWNPVNHVTKWKTPMLVIIADKDYRVPYTQGLGAFTALQRRGVPSRLLRYPDENHWILKPQNSIQWYDEVFSWMDRWTRPAVGQQ
jgi:dipeptidyl aminopeptidase/acylaminoacyl peptidase